MSPAIRAYLFPVETFNREVDFRLLQAARWASPTRRIFLGKHPSLMRVVPCTEGAIYVGKHVITPHLVRDVRDLRILHAHGGTFMHHDTEGAVYTGAEEQWRQVLRSRLDPQVLSSHDWVLTWGLFQQETYRETGAACAANIVATGTPQLDMLKRPNRAFFRAGADHLRAKYGRFILVNTNFSRANHKLGLPYVFSPASGYMATDQSSRARTVSSWSRQVTAVARFVGLVHELRAAFPQTVIVVRPHPSEDLSFYRTTLGGLDRVVVAHEGPVGPWLLAARCVVHDGCTTGLEAYFAECPVISFRANSGDDGAYLPNAFGIRANSVADVVAAVADAEIAALRPVEVPERAAMLLQNFCESAFENIERAMASAEEVAASARCPTHATVQRLESRAFAVERAKRLVRGFSPRRQASYRYAKAKFPGFTASLLNSKLADVGAVAKRRVRATIFSEDLIAIDSA